MRAQSNNCTFAQLWKCWTIWFQASEKQKYSFELKFTFNCSHRTFLCSVRSSLRYHVILRTGQQAGNFLDFHSAQRKKFHNSRSKLLQHHQLRATQATIIIWWGVPTPLSVLVQYATKLNMTFLQCMHIWKLQNYIFLGFLTKTWIDILFCAIPTVDCLLLTGS